MATRYSGALTITVTYRDGTRDHPDGYYRVTVRGVKGSPPWSSTIASPAAGYGPGVAYDSVKAYDQVARAAISFFENETGNVAHAGAELNERGELVIRRTTRIPGLPKYNSTQGWTGGDSKTLYAFKDTWTGRVVVRPGCDVRGVGPNVTVRIATRKEAEELWQSPLHSGWKVKG